AAPPCPSGAVSPPSFTLLFLLLRRPPRPPLFPYTTLFRSHPGGPRLRPGSPVVRAVVRAPVRALVRALVRTGGRAFFGTVRAVRSEEHTSELQSRENLVCRLLLDKKKTKIASPY